MYEEIERQERKDAFATDAHFFERNFIDPPLEIIKLRDKLYEEMNISDPQLFIVERWHHCIDVILMNLYMANQIGINLMYGRSNHFFAKTSLCNHNAKLISRSKIKNIFDRLVYLGYVKQHIGFHISKDFGKLTRIILLDKIKNLFDFKLENQLKVSYDNDYIVRVRDDNKRLLTNKVIAMTDLDADEMRLQFQNNLKKINSLTEESEITLSIPFNSINDNIIKILEQKIVPMLKRNHIEIVNNYSLNIHSIISIMSNIKNNISYYYYLKNTKSNLYTYLSILSNIRDTLGFCSVSTLNHYKFLKYNDSLEIRILNKKLYRVFKNDLRTGGRFYGPVHQRMPSAIRKFIKIDGQETVELDYQAFHYRMMYNVCKLDYQEDPFKLEDRSIRKYFKQVGVIMLNCEGKNRAIKAVLNWCKKENLPTKRKTVQFLVNTIESRCAPIIKLFYHGLWGKLQFHDSILMEQILLDSIDLNMVALPIHDSIIIQKKNHSIAKRIMFKKYKEKFKFDPVIDDK